MSLPATVRAQLVDQFGHGPVTFGTDTRRRTGPRHLRRLTRNGAFTDIDAACGAPHGRGTTETNHHHDTLAALCAVTCTRCRATRLHGALVRAATTEFAHFPPCRWDPTSGDIPALNPLRDLLSRHPDLADAVAAHVLALHRDHGLPAAWTTPWTRHTTPERLARLDPDFADLARNVEVAAALHPEPAPRTPPPHAYTTA